MKPVWFTVRRKLSKKFSNSQNRVTSGHLRVPLLCRDHIDSAGETMPGVDYQAIRAAVTMTQVLDLISFEATERLGEQLRGPCPIHGPSSESSRSFSANVAKNAFRCFRCGASGNQLDLWAAVSKMKLHAATIALCERLGIDVPSIPATQPSKTAAGRVAVNHRTEKEPVGISVRFALRSIVHFHLCPSYTKRLHFLRP